jgi:hypothetical protein
MVLVTEIEVLEILKRAREFQSGEGVSAFESKANVREEAIRRSHKAGHCNSEGGPISAGKGDSYRPVDKKKYDENYDRIFNKE